MVVYHRFVWRPGSYADVMAILSLPVIAILLFMAVRTLVGVGEKRPPRIELPPLPRSTSDDR